MQNMMGEVKLINPRFFFASFTFSILLPLFATFFKFKNQWLFRKIMEAKC